MYKNVSESDRKDIHWHIRWIQNILSKYDCEITVSIYDVCDGDRTEEVRSIGKNLG